MEYDVRAIRAEEWAPARELRLAALSDPLASVAFLETYEKAVERSEAWWRERTALLASGDGQCQFVAVGPDTVFAGSVGAVLERPGTVDEVVGLPVDRLQAHLYGVYVRPEHRGSGLTDALFAAALDWAWSQPGVERVRLIVNGSNPRAEGFYRRAGFVRTGLTLPFALNPALLEYEMEMLRQSDAR
ncbi:GNAT family N-acetyltransferase [Streptomyces uncialis]|uniref:GNAT family N-acetyltransferase n=1 Tax=Streptomyces uncialis TaxID=1048205 RepID=UPI003863EC4C|nr:GNAT family N-acetyltransferase [Streptomyces uncialis]